MTKTKDRPYWFPVLCDESYFARLREDYEEDAAMSDEELHEKYNDGLKYQQLWDHTGDAYSDFEPLADDYIKLRSAIELAVRGVRAEVNDTTQGTAEILGKIDMRIDELSKALDLS